MFNTEKRIINKLKQQIKIESFLKVILDKLEFYLCDVNIDLNVKKNNMIIKTNHNLINIAINDNGVVYKEENKYKKLIREYKKVDEVYIVKSTDISEVIYELETSDSINRKTVAETRIYNEQCKEIYRGIKTNVDNYLQDRKTKEVKLHDPDVMENYEEREFHYRIEDKYVIKRTIKKYNYPDGTEAFMTLKNSDNVYLRYEMINAETMDIPTWGHYYEIDKDVFFNYNQYKASSNDIVENFKSKKYYISHDTFF